MVQRRTERGRIKQSTRCGLCGKPFTAEQREKTLYVYSIHTDTFYHLFGLEDCDRTNPDRPERDDPPITKSRFKTL